jgi:hypothetical protein
LYIDIVAKLYAVPGPALVLRNEKMLASAALLVSHGTGPSAYNPATVLTWGHCAIGPTQEYNPFPYLILPLDRRYYDNSVNMNMKVNMTIAMDMPNTDAAINMDMDSDTDKDTDADTNRDTEMDMEMGYWNFGLSDIVKYRR